MVNQEFVLIFKFKKVKVRSTFKVIFYMRYSE